MSKSYLVAIYSKIIDSEKLQQYGEGAGPSMSKNGAKTLARGSKITGLEGIPPERAVILEFESIDDAQKAYNSAEYQQSKKKLEGGANRILFVIEGL